MSSAEYLAITAGLAGLWTGVDRVIGWLGEHEHHVFWSLALPI